MDITDKITPQPEPQLMMLKRTDPFWGCRYRPLHQTIA